MGATGARGATGAVRCTGARALSCGTQVRCAAAPVHGRWWTRGLGAGVAIAGLAVLASASVERLNAQQVTPASREAAPVAAAAQAQDAEQVRDLLKRGVDVNAAQGDGMTALHWATMHGNAEMATMLLYAGANVRATTRLGSFTPLHLASQAGAASLIEPIIKAGGSVAARTSTGVTPLMFAATSGSVDTVAKLLAAGADIDAVEERQGETAVMFAADANRAEVVKALLAAGAQVGATTKIVDLAALTAAPGEEALQQVQRGGRGGAPAAAGGGRGASATPAAPRLELPGVTRPFRYNELIGRQGGLTALLFAARQGAFDTARMLVEGGADVNHVSPADNASPLLMATINGHFDLAMYLLERGANPNVASEAGATPLYAAVNVQWAPKSFYPQPRAYLQQRASYLDLMKALLDKGADPNARLKRKIWYTSYNFDNLRVDEIGATPFWRAAYASDIEAMKLLVAGGADPHTPTSRPAGRTTRGDPGQPQVPIEDKSGKPPVPVGGPGIPPLQAAAGTGYGEGFAGNAHRFAPTGMLAAVKYLVDELHADVNAEDYDGNTALHHAAARGDVAMILYLVEKGADPKKLNREGQSTADMANGPVQRTQPYPEARDLLVKLGAINHNKCVSC
jgi:ankyrin repeat protein